MSNAQGESLQLFVIAEATQRRLEAFTYVHTTNAARYRTIARFLLHSHDRLCDWVTPEDIYDGVRRWLDADYTPDLLRLDLQAMVEWQAIGTDQDKTKATSLEAFYRTRLVYRLTAPTMEFERLLVKLDAPAASGGVLNATLLQRLWHAVEQLNVALEIAAQTQLNADEIRRDIVEHWAQVMATLRDLQEGARDFYQTLGAALPADSSALGPFLIYKDALKTYLTGFLAELQEYHPRLARRLQRWRSMAYPELLTQLLARHDVESHIARLSASGAPFRPTEIAEQVHAPALAGVMNWLAVDGGASTLVEKTKSAIIFIVTQNERLVSRHSVGNSRRRDLQRLAELFVHIARANAPPDAAAKLWARAMSAIVPRHLRGGSSEQSVLAPNESTWLQTPIEYPLRTYRRGRRTQGTTAKVGDHREVLAAARQEEEEHIEYERALWDRLLVDGTISTSRLILEDERLRTPILDLIAQARLDPDGMAITRDGQQIRIEVLDQQTEFGEPARDETTERPVSHAATNWSPSEEREARAYDELASMGRVVAPDGTLFLPRVRLVAIQRQGGESLAATEIDRNVNGASAVALNAASLTGAIPA